MRGLNFANAWSKETSHPAYNWSPDNPSAGQCAVTALVVQDLLGGDILACKVGRISHFVNFIEGQIVDYTAEQFGKNEVSYTNIHTRDRASLLKNQDVRKRYLLLKANLQHAKN